MAVDAVLELMPLTVALRKESVDRNDTLSALAPKQNRRSPQGERG